MAMLKLEDDKLDADNIKSFVTDFLEGKIEQHLMSEEVPKDWDKEGVEALVGKNFHEMKLPWTPKRMSLVKKKITLKLNFVLL